MYFHWIKEIKMSKMKKPNIIYILVDNLGWGDISAQGGAIQTPRIDALAQEGLRLTNFNVESQCTPTRSALLTGRLPIRSETNRVTYGLPYGLAPYGLNTSTDKNRKRNHGIPTIHDL